MKYLEVGNNYLEKFVLYFTILLMILAAINLFRYYRDTELKKPDGFVPFVTITFLLIICTLIFFMIMSSTKLFEMSRTK